MPNNAGHMKQPLGGDLADPIGEKDRPPSRVTLFGCRFDDLTMQEVVEILFSWTRDIHDVCRYVVTPNVNHIVQLQKNEVFRRAYENADLVLVDGKWILFSARFLGCPIRGLVPGSDLVPAFLASAERRGGLRVFLLGAAPGVADRAATNIEQRWPSVKVVGTYSPPFGFEDDERECAAILDSIRHARPQLLIIGLGAPKQECWISKNRSLVDANVALCVGATIDFLAGKRARAPMWVRRNGFEWLFRALTEPRRLGKRYLRDGLVFPGLIIREWVRRNLGHFRSGID